MDAIITEPRPLPDSALLKAVDLTERLFSEADKIPALFCGYNLVWSLYDRVHLEVSIPRQLRSEESQDPVLKGAAAYSLFTWVREAGRQLLPFLFSLASLIRFRIGGKPSVAIWTGDFFDERTGGDFRLGDLYLHLQSLEVPFIEFIRTNQRGGVVQAFKHAWIRKRWAVYYDACAFFLSSNRNIPGLNLSGLSDPDARAVFSRYERDLAITRSSAGIFAAWFRILNIRTLIAWEFSSRQAALIVAAKSLGLPVIGFMHGAGMRTYMMHEFLPAKAGKIGPDIFGVWSAWWKEYYTTHAGIYGHVEVAGPMRPPSIQLAKKKPTTETKPMALWISEPLLAPKEAVVWLRHLRKNYRLIIKKRPFTSDSFYNGLIEQFPEFKEVETRDGDIFQAFVEANVVLGSHSTGVIDASLMGVPFVLVSTRKWGDYFELSGYDAPFRMYVQDTDELDLSLHWLKENNPTSVLESVRNRFYGDGVSDGSRWVAERAFAAMNGRLN